jgi:hypothetical protein
VNGGFIVGLVTLVANRDGGGGAQPRLFLAIHRLHSAATGANTKKDGKSLGIQGRLSFGEQMLLLLATRVPATGQYRYTIEDGSYRPPLRSHDRSAVAVKLTALGVEEPHKRIADAESRGLARLRPTRPPVDPLL